MHIIEWVTRARRRGCPLLAVTTPEPLGMVQELGAMAYEQGLAAWMWDCARGAAALTAQAQEYERDGRLDSPDQMLEWCQRVPSDGLVVAQWHGEYWQDVVVRQGMMNLRDVYKGDGRTLVLVGRGLQVHQSLASDFLHYEEHLPDGEALRQCAEQVHRNAGIQGEMDGEAVVDALRGMTLFEAEQQCAMAACKEGINVAALWQAKMKLINSCQGLHYWQGNETGADVRGLDGVVGYLQATAQGKQPVRLVLWVDEAEDTLAGVEGDTSGISQDYLAQLAAHMVDTEARGLCLYGHPGTGKSLTAKVAGSVFQCPVLAFDMGGMKGSLVGESEQNMRHALAIERAIVGGQKGVTMFVWTTNNIERIPPKIRSRSQPEFFYDLPGEQEQLSILSLYLQHYGLERQTLPNIEGWTGREIKQVCFEAWNKNLTLVQAAQYVVPGIIGQRDAIEERRKRASGRYLDASKGGVFQWTVSGGQTEGRKVAL